MKKSLITLAALSTLSIGAFAQGYQAGDFVIRGGYTSVDPNSDKAGVYVGALGGDTPLSVSVDDNVQLGLNFVYFLDSNWAVEVLAATPFKHEVTIHDPQGIAAGVFAVEGLDVDGSVLAEVTHLPPTVSALYYFDTNSAFLPYIGAGLNYTIFFDEEFNAAPKGLGFNDLELDGSFGLAFQVGADYQLNDNWMINTSVRYIDIDSDVSFKIGEDIKGSTDVEVDPVVFSLMVGYKF